MALDEVAGLVPPETSTFKPLATAASRKRAAELWCEYLPGADLSFEADSSRSWEVTEA